MRDFLLIALLWLGPSSWAQEYFQQEVDYKISVALDDAAHVLEGEIEITYRNNSNETLEEMYFHLWPNAYASRTTALAKQKREKGDLDLEFSEASERGFIEGVTFSVDGIVVEHEPYQGHSDVVRFTLPEALKSGELMEIRTPFKVKIPSSKFSRLGHIGQSYQITQWYPKPAVFDADGWHPMPYLNQGEFYSEFGSFDVSITLPKNYLVGATGELQNEDERKFLIDQAAAYANLPWEGGKNEFPESWPSTKTLRYTQDKVHDFAWFADKRFHVLHERFQLDSGKEVDGWVFFTDAHADTWAKSMEYLVDGTRHYSRHVGDYPYSQVSVVDGTLAAGGGMEYPMVTVINGTSNARRLEQVIVHEVGHNWFYGILGSNERKDPWMDEGVNSYYEQRYFNEKYGQGGEGLKDLLSGNFSGLQEFAYLYSACRHQDQSLAISSDEYSSINYGTMVYMKGAKVMDHLSSILGEEEFHEAMKDYFEEWKFQHPSPADMQKSLERSTGKDLSWMFADLISSRAKVDHRICRSKHEEGAVEIHSKTSFTGPISVGFFKDTVLTDLKVGVGERFEISSSTDFDRVLIDPYRQSLQLSRKNDELRTKGIFKTWKTPSFKPLMGSGMSYRSSIYYFPVLAWNDQDRWMPGLYLSNSEILYKDMEWTAIPLFSVRGERLTGLFSIRQSIWPQEEGPGRLDLSLHTKRFSLRSPSGATAIPLLSTLPEEEELGMYYFKIQPGFKYSYQDPSQKRGKHEVYLNHHYVQIDRVQDEKVMQKQIFNFSEFGYDYSQRSGVGKRGVGGRLEFHDSYQKLTIHAGLDRVYDELKNRWSLRVYAGKMWFQEFIPLGARLSLNGQDGEESVTGAIDDYRFDHLFFERQVSPEDVSGQIVRNRGGFIQSSRLGYSDDWVIALNSELDLPLPIPVSFFVNFGWYDAGSQGTQNLHEGGLRLNIIREIFDISFPMWQSNDIQEDLEFQGIKYRETIRFQLRLDKVSVRNLVDNLSF